MNRKIQVSEVPRWSKLALLFLLLIVTALGLLFAQSTGEGKNETRFQEHLRKAREQGLQEIEMPPSRGIPAVVGSLKEAFQVETVLLVQLEDEKSVLAKDESQIWTWYKFKVIQNLSNKSLPAGQIGTTQMSSTVPSSFLSLNADEILVRQEGGNIQSGGITVKSPHLHGGFEGGQKYLLFVNFYPYDKTDMPTRAGEIDLGASGIYKVSNTGQIEPISSKAADSAIARDLNSIYGNSLSSLQANLNNLNK